MRFWLVIVFVLFLIAVACLLSPNKPDPESGVVKTTKIDPVWRTVEFEGRRFLIYSNTNQCALVELK